MSSGKKHKKTQDTGEHQPVSYFDRQIEVLKKLNRKNAQYVLVGGLACNLHGLVRATKDIDLLIPKNLENTEKILEVLRELPWGIAKELEAEVIYQKPFTIIGDDPRVDLLIAAGSVQFAEASHKCIRRKIKNVTIPYADIDTLLKTKNTNRPTDIADVLQLQEIKKQEPPRDSKQKIVLKNE